MNKFTKKGIIQKIILVLICLTVFNFIYPYIPSYAATVEEQNAEITGGILLSPIISLVTIIADSALNIIHKMVMGSPSAFVNINNGESGWATFAGWVGGIIAGAAVIVGVVAFTIFTGGTGIVVIMAGIGAVGSALWVGVAAGGTAATITASMIPDDFYIPMFSISPEQIFAGQIPILDVNFINPTKYIQKEDGKIEIVKDNLTKEQEEKLIKTPAMVLQQQISNWYVSIRNLALVALMIVLLYIGIRIVISSSAGEKSKYKEMIKDWLIAMTLIVFMHYIMTFAIEGIGKITKLLNSFNPVIQMELPYMEIPKESQDIFPQPEKIKGKTGEDAFNFGTNLMGQARILQQLEQDGKGNGIITYDRVGYTIIYVALVMYTVMFLFIYIKRVIYLAFLTIISPLVALTYPIDKMNDGSAQGFNSWLKEYIFNLLLQPFHLLLYIIIIGSVMEIATENMLYALVALGFLLPAEKLLRGFFGFEKSKTASGIMGGAVGGAMAMTAINKLGKLGSSGKKGGEKDSGGNGETPKIRENNRTADDRNNTDNLLGEAFGGDNRNQDRGEVRQAQNGNQERNISENGNAEETYADRLGRVPTMRNFQAGAINETNERHPLGQGLKNSRGINAIGSGVNKIRSGAKKAINSSAGKTIIAGAKTIRSVAGKRLYGVAKKAPRAILKGYGAATIGALGLAAGLASDDYGNVLKYGAAGGAVGAGLGNSAANLGNSAVGVGKEVGDTFMQNRFTSKEYETMMNEKLDRNWRRNSAVKTNYKEKFGDDYKQAMKDAEEYRKHGITDDKLIMKTMKEDGLGKADSKERIAVAKIASTVKSDKELSDYGKRLSERGISEAQIKDINTRVRRMKKM